MERNGTLKMAEAAIATQLQNDWNDAHGSDLETNEKLWALAKQFHDVQEGIEVDGEKVRLSYSKQAKAIGASATRVSQYARTWRAYGDGWEDGGENGEPLAFHEARHLALGTNAADLTWAKHTSSARKVLREDPDVVWPEIEKVNLARGWSPPAEEQEQDEKVVPLPAEADEAPDAAVNGIEVTGTETEAPEAEPDEEPDEVEPDEVEEPDLEPAAASAATAPPILASEVEPEAEPEPELSEKELAALSAEEQKREHERKLKRAESVGLDASGSIARFAQAKAPVAVEHLDFAFDEHVLSEEGYERFLAHVADVEDGLAILNSSLIVEQEERKQARQLSAVEA